MEGRVGIVVAARVGSSRLAGKALLQLYGLPMCIFLMRRLRGSRKADAIVFATTCRREDDVLAEMVRAEGIPVVRGASQDVVERYVIAAEEHGLDYVVRVTGDCPFVDAETLDFVLARCEGLGNFDVASTKGAFPIGIDYEIYPASTMARLHREAPLSAADREHLTKYFYDHADAHKICYIEPDPRWRSAGVRFTVDWQEDYERARRVVEHFGRYDFSVEDLVKLARDVL